MLHFNQRDWFRMFPDENTGISEPKADPKNLPNPSTAKEYYLAKMAGATLTKKMAPPRPKTATEFYLAKMAGVEVVTYETVLEKELTFVAYEEIYRAEITRLVNPEEAEITRLVNPEEYAAYLNNLLNTEQCFMDGVVLDSATIVADGLAIRSDRSNTTNRPTIYLEATDSSYAENTHTIKFIEKNIIEDVPVKTKTEKYLKAIAANQNL